MENKRVRTVTQTVTYGVEASRDPRYRAVGPEMEIRSATPPLMKPAVVVKARAGRGWNDRLIAAIDERLRLAMRVLAHARVEGGSSGGGASSVWAHVPVDLAPIDRVGLKTALPDWQPSAREITSAWEAYRWVLDWIEDASLRRLVFIRATPGTSWSEIATAFRAPERTIRRRHRGALQTIAEKIVAREKNSGQVGPIIIPSAA